MRQSGDNKKQKKQIEVCFLIQQSLIVIKKSLIKIILDFLKLFPTLYIFNTKKMKLIRF